MLGLQHAGYTVLLPFGENVRYDLVIDDGRELARVQCKTGRLRNGSVSFATCSTYGHHPNPAQVRRHYAGQIEYFGVHCLDTGGVYLIPIEAVPVRREAALRVEPCRNSQRKRIRHAADYEICKVALSAGLRVTAGA
jgi:hypothetical protein